MHPIQYIIANKGAGMSPGKLASQVAHAAVFGAAYTSRTDSSLYDQWIESGHTKIVLEGRDNDHMAWAERYLTDQGLVSFIIIDEGHTEVPPLTPTALGFPVLDKDDPDVQFAFSTFKLYKDEPPAGFGHPERGARRWWQR